MGCVHLLICLYEGTGGGMINGIEEAYDRSCLDCKMYLSNLKIVFVKNDLLCVPSDLYTRRYRWRNGQWERRRL